MAKVIVAHHPELTAEDAMKVFESHFAGKYGISGLKIFKWGFYFVVKKSSWSGANVKLIQKRNQTAFVISGETPSLAVKILFIAFVTLFFTVLAIWVMVAGGAGGFILVLLICLCLYAFGSRYSKKIVNEIKTFIENAEEFR